MAGGDSKHPSFRDAIPTLLYVVTGGLALAVGLGARSRVLEGTGMLVLSALVTHVLVVALGVVLVRRRPRALNVLVILSSVGAFGSCGAGPAALVVANSAGDPSVHDQVVIAGATREHTHRSKTSYYVTLEPWFAQEEPLELQVDGATYAAVRAKGPGKHPLKLSVGEGRLGIAHIPLDWGVPRLKVE
ncbi:MAG: hypothetical protein IPM35_12345 [Myxococcales bacterium]|nr:hypothetical protein [Myxococcales bacterium]